MSGRHACDDGCERGGVAALEFFEQHRVYPLGMGFGVIEQPFLEGHQQRLEHIRPDGHTAVQAPEAWVHPLLARPPVFERELDFPGGFEAVVKTQMRLPLRTMIEDLDLELIPLSRLVCEQVDPWPPEGTGRDKIVVQVFLDTEV